MRKVSGVTGIGQDGATSVSSRSGFMNRARSAASSGVTLPRLRAVSSVSSAASKSPARARQKMRVGKAGDRPGASRSSGRRAPRRRSAAPRRNSGGTVRARRWAGGVQQRARLIQRADRQQLVDPGQQQVFAGRRHRQAARPRPEGGSAADPAARADPAAHPPASKCAMSAARPRPHRLRGRPVICGGSMPTASSEA